jgi:flagellar biosynthesis/type III secretory pathway chaperone
MGHAEIREIAVILSDEKDLMGKLLACSEQKKAFIIKDDIDSLENLLFDEETMISDLRTLEDRRALLVTQLAARLRVSESELTLNALAGLVEDPGLKQKITALHRDLSELLKRQKKCNKITKELVNRKNSCIGAMLELMLQTGPSADTYDSCGYAKARYTSSALFDQSV